MKRKIFVTLCAVVFGCMSVFGASEKYPVSLNTKDWNNFRFFSRPNKNCTVSNLEENGKQLLRVTFSKTPGVKDLSPCAYRQFIPILDTGNTVNSAVKSVFRLRYPLPLFASITKAGRQKAGKRCRMSVCMITSGQKIFLHKSGLI